MATKKVLRLLRGSHSFGTNTADSDRDYLDIILPAEDQIIGLRRFENKQILNKGDDTTTVSLIYFVQAAFLGNIELIAALFGREDCIIETSPAGKKLWNLRDKLLSKRIIKKMFGFANGQLACAFNGNKGRFNQDLGYDPKAGYHGVRSLYTLRYFLKTGIYSSYIEAENERDTCIAIKNGKISRSLLELWFRELLSECENITPHWSILDDPNFEFWNKWVIETYKEYLCQK